MSEEYVDRIATKRTDPDARFLRFVEALPPGDGAILDWGAGVGQFASLLTSQGLTVEATDASPELAEIASGLGISVRIECFDELAQGARFRGIWANMSLCHVHRVTFPEMIGLAASVLLPDGILYLNLKEGTGEDRDGLGRLFSYWTEAELDAITSAAGLAPFYRSQFERTSFTGTFDRCIVHISARSHA